LFHHRGANKVELDQSARRQLARYLASGGIAAESHFLILCALVEGGGVTHLVATVIGFSAAIAVNYTLQYYWTFNVKARHLVTFGRYLAVTFVMLCLNTALFWLFNMYLGVGYLLAQVCATALVTAINFAVNRSFTFQIG